jgi:hypothetical protein
MLYTRLAGLIAAFMLIVGLLNFGLYIALATELISGFPGRPGQLINYAIYSIIAGAALGVLSDISEKLEILLSKQSEDSGGEQ